MATNSGGNEMNGDAWEFVRNDVFDSRPFNVPDPNAPKYQRNQFGGTVGGPIRKKTLLALLVEAYAPADAASALTGQTAVIPSPRLRCSDRRYRRYARAPDSPR